MCEFAVAGLSSRRSGMVPNGGKGSLTFSVLTYMSIEDLIVDRVKRGMLYPLIPRARGEAARRAMFVGERLWGVITSPQGDAEWEQRIGELQADLERFAEGQVIDPKYLFLLYPARDAVWEIRSTGANPSIRVLGLFAGKDIFVATNFAMREDLDGWESREWKNVKRTAAAEWRNLFHPYEPCRAISVQQLVTGALDGKYFKA